MKYKWNLLVVLVVLCAISRQSAVGDVYEVTSGEKQYKLYFPVELQNAEIKEFIKEDIDRTLKFAKGIEFEEIDPGESPIEFSEKLYKFRLVKLDSISNPKFIPKVLYEYFNISFESENGEKHLIIRDGLIKLYIEKYKEHVVVNNSLMQLKEFIKKLNDGKYLNDILNNEKLLFSEVYIEESLSADDVKADDLKAFVKQFKEAELNLYSVFHILNDDGEKNFKYKVYLPIIWKKTDRISIFSLGVYTDKNWKIYVHEYF